MKIKQNIDSDPAVKVLAGHRQHTQQGLDEESLKTGMIYRDMGRVIGGIRNLAAEGSVTSSRSEAGNCNLER